MLLKPVSFLKKQAATSWYPTDLGAKLIVLVDPSDTTSLFTDSDNSKATNPTADGDTIYDVNDLSGNSNHLRPWASGDTTATYKTSGGKHWLNFVETALMTTGVLSSTTTTDEVYIAIKTTDSNFIFAGFSAGASFVGAAGDTETTSPHSWSTAPTYLADNSPISSPNRDDLHTNWCTGSGVVAGIQGFDTTAIVFGRTSSYVGWGLNSTTWLLTGDVYAIVHTTVLTTGERASLQTWMSGLF